MPLLVFCFPKRSQEPVYITATSELNRWFLEICYKMNLVIGQSLRLNIPRCDLYLDQLASFSNSKCLHIMPKTVPWHLEKHLSNIWCCTRGSQRRGKNARWSKMQISPHCKKVTLRIYGTLHWGATSKLDLNHHTLTLKGNWNRQVWLNTIG